MTLQAGGDSWGDGSWDRLSWGPACTTEPQRALTFAF